MKNIPSNSELYNKVKQEADNLFKEKTSVYKSSWIVREYKKRGGKYEGEKNDKEGLIRWYKEKWIDLNKLQAGIISSCGRKDKNESYPLCRPLYRVTKDTPKTVNEIDTKTIRKNLRVKKKIEGSRRVKF